MGVTTVATKPRKKASKTATFADYLASAGNLPEEAFVGMLAWFTITKRAQVTPAEIEQRFHVLNLNPAHIPAPMSAANAYRKATGPEAGEHTYRLADGHDARVLLRNLPSDRETMTRIIVRERIDTQGKKLGHEEVGRITFYKAQRGQTGTERIRFALHDERLQTGERADLEAFCTAINNGFETYKTYLYDQPLRAMVREYILDLNAFSVRPSGGLYFLHRSKWEEVRRLTQLVEGLHEGCTFVTSPLVDLPEMRDMLIEAYQDEVVDEVSKLVEEISDLRASGKDIKPEKLSEYGERVRGIAAKAEEHGRNLEASQDRTAGALENAWTVLASLASAVV